MRDKDPHRRNALIELSDIPQLLATQRFALNTRLPFFFLGKPTKYCCCHQANIPSHYIRIFIVHHLLRAHNIHISVTIYRPVHARKFRIFTIYTLHDCRRPFVNCRLAL